MPGVNEKGDKRIIGSPAGGSLESADIHAARTADASSIKAVQKLNRDAHNGSAGGNDQLESIQIMAAGFDGKPEIIAARQPERLESVSMEALILKARGGDEFAIGMVQQMRAAKELPAPQQEKVIAKQQVTVDKMYCRKYSTDSASSGSLGKQQNRLEEIDTQVIKVLAPSNEVARSALEMRQNIEKHVPLGPERDKLIAQLKADVTPVLKAHVEKNGYEEQNVFTRRDDNEWQAFSKLSPVQQRAVIEAFQNGSIIGQEAYEQQIQAVAESVPRGFYNAGKGLYNSAIGAGTFLIESAQSPEKLQGAALKLSDSLSTAIVNGLKISYFVANYGQETAESGDFNRLLGDLQSVTTIANERWEAIPLEKRTEKASELIADMGLGSFIGAADKLAKSGKLIDGLESLAKYAKDLTSPGREKARQSLGSFLDDVFQPKAVTPDGRKVAIPQESRDNYLMSKADDLGDQEQRLADSGNGRNSIPQKFLPSQRFVTELQNVVEGLSEAERSCLAKHDIQVKPVRRITDIFTGTAHRTAGCFDASEKTIYIAEEVYSKGHWIPNNDLPFMFRHEFGHAYNAKFHPFGDPLSEAREFRDAFKLDTKVIPAETFNDLQIPTHSIAACRDEIFADLYAHATGFESNNPRSTQMKALFPKCLEYLQKLRSSQQ